MGAIPGSDVETFVALESGIDNWRWAGVPFYLRTGKRLAEGQRIISIAFREPPKSMFPAGSGVGAQGPDHLTFDLADASKVSLSFYGKRPGPGMRLDKQSLQFAMHDTGLLGDVLEAYERLILDAMRNDHTLFTTAEGIERLWEVSVPLLEAPLADSALPLRSWGPKSVHQLIAPERIKPAVRARLARPEQDGKLRRRGGGGSRLVRLRRRRGLAGVFNGSPVYDNTGDPQKQNPSGVSFPTNGGVLAIAELQFQYPGSGAQAKANTEDPWLGPTRSGFWYDSESFVDLRYDTTGLPLGNPRTKIKLPRAHRGNYAFYAVADQMIWRGSLMPIATSTSSCVRCSTLVFWMLAFASMTQCWQSRLVCDRRLPPGSPPRLIQLLSCAPTACAKAVGWDDVDGRDEPGHDGEGRRSLLPFHSEGSAGSRTRNDGRLTSPSTNIASDVWSMRFAFQPITLFDTRFLEL